MRTWHHALMFGTLALTTGTLAGCSGSSTPAAATQAAASVSAPKIAPWGFDLTGMNTSVAPGHDFYTFGVGKWVERADIPADLPEWHGFADLTLKIEADLKSIFDELAKAAPPPGSIEQKVADAYFSYLDTAKINALGLEPFKADLAAIRAARTPADVARLIGTPGFAGNSPVAFGPSVDAKNPDRYVLLVGQAGLGLPSRDYYLADAPAYAAVREKYREYIEQLFTLAGYPSAKTAAAGVVALEKHIAELHWPLEKARNKDLTYNPKTRAELIAFAPGFPWQVAFDAMGVGAFDRIVVRESDAVLALATLFAATPVETWKAYLTFHYLSSQADIMPMAFDEASFNFNGKILGGQQQPRERWRRAVSDVNGPYAAGPLGDAVGRLYVKEHFPPEARAQVLALVKDLLDAYQRRIANLEWMSPDTRKAAIRKAQTVRVKIGYPDRWKDYSALTITPGDAYGNRKRISVFETNRLVSRIDAPTDREEWGQGPQVINAYYNAQFNEIGFPAAILQPPFFDPRADMAVNYGGIGGVIGHEMGHGYDDQGAKSDEKGVLRNWWQPEDEARFKVLTKKLSAQFATYSPLPGLYANGDFTSGENIGDLGGLSVALDAYQHALGGKAAPVIDGYTGTQRFFLAWAQVWRAKYREERIRQLISSDYHSLNPFRVNGVVRNIDAWYDAFNVKPGDALYLKPEDRVHIW